MSIKEIEKEIQVTKKVKITTVICDSCNHQEDGIPDILEYSLLKKADEKQLEGWSQLTRRPFVTMLCPSCTQKVDALLSSIKPEKERKNGKNK